MVSEIVKFLKPRKGGIFIDGTLGSGGHSRALLEKNPKIKIIGIDLDEDAIKESKKSLKKFLSQVFFVQDNFSNIKNILTKLKIEKVDGIILDLGVSSHQLDSPEKGFSFNNSESLDMRFSKNQKLTAQDILNNYDYQKLKDIFQKLGESQFAGRIASGIIKAGQSHEISTPKQLIEIIKRSTPPKWRYGQSTHFATNIFRALRMEVNDELGNLVSAIPEMINVLKPGGRIAIITFHSLEDRLVKKTFQTLEHPCTCLPKFPVCVCGKLPVLKILTKKPILPSNKEISKNPRARSAKLRIAEKL
jgi:16S rRNA (cytosine1402-N4)-methyltransferase